MKEAVRPDGRRPGREAAATRAEDLRRRIWHHRKRYYADSDPEISDAEYDLLERELLQIEADYPDLTTADSPTQRVGAEVTGDLPTVRHSAAMLSLDNAVSSEELREWHDRLLRVLDRSEVPLAAELKIDGVSVSLIYENGSLARAVSRGDGVVGEEVTVNVPRYRTRFWPPPWVSAFRTPDTVTLQPPSWICPSEPVAADDVTSNDAAAPTMTELAPYAQR